MFFELFSTWDYAKPILIHKINHWEADHDLYDESMKSYLPILTPMRPPQCTTFGTTLCARNKIVDELQRAHDICRTVRNKRELKSLALQLGKRGDETNEESKGNNSGATSVEEEGDKASTIFSFNDVTWTDLFEPEVFFLNHKIFLEA
jgi:poly(A) polymerase Pap1